MENKRRVPILPAEDRNFIMFIFLVKLRDTGAVKEMNQTINLTMTGLYYQKTSNVGTIYSERYGQMCLVTKLDESRYGVILPNEKQSIYTYRQGLFIEV